MDETDLYMLIRMDSLDILLDDIFSSPTYINESEEFRTLLEDYIKAEATEYELVIEEETDPVMFYKIQKEKLATYYNNKIEVPNLEKKYNRLVSEGLIELTFSDYTSDIDYTLTDQGAEIINKLRSQLGDLYFLITHFENQVPSFKDTLAASIPDITSDDESDFND